MKKRIDAMQQQAAKVPGLQKQIDGLKRQLDSLPASEPTPKAKPAPTPEPVEGFSSVEPPLPEGDKAIPESREIVRLADSPDQSQAFPIAQARRDDGFTAKQSNVTAIFDASFLRSSELAALSTTTNNNTR